MSMRQPLRKIHRYEPFLLECATRVAVFMTDKLMLEGIRTVLKDRPNRLCSQPG